MGEVIKSIGVNDIAERAHVSRQTLSKLTNKRSNASYKTIHAVERALGLI
ncbi:DNA-binding protein [Persicobacter diffluens]